MDLGLAVLSAVGGYLLGGISFPRLVAKLASPNTDVENVEIKDDQGYTLHPSAMGATTVSAKLGWQAGCASSGLDILKTFLPTLILKLIFPEQPYFLIYALFAVIGNNWPVYYRFKGGWGVSATFGSLFAVDPLGALVTMIASFILGMLMRDFMILFYSSILLMIPWLWFRTHDWMHMVYIIGVNIAMMIALYPETRKYLKDPRLARLDDSGLAARVPMGRGLIKMMDMLGMNKK